jgi:hypothetical protein
MTQMHTTTPADAGLSDVFAAARWLDGLWNATARATSPDEVEWPCCTWGSAQRRGDREQFALFVLVAKVFGLPSGANRAGRNELVVLVPLACSLRFGR